MIASMSSVLDVTSACWHITFSLQEQNHLVWNSYIKIHNTKYKCHSGCWVCATNYRLSRSWVQSL